MRSSLDAGRTDMIPRDVREPKTSSSTPHRTAYLLDLISSHEIRVRQTSPRDEAAIPKESVSAGAQSVARVCFFLRVPPVARVDAVRPHFMGLV